MQFALNEDQIAVREMAREFAAEKIAPHAIRWDEEKHFPVDVMREAASLGIGGVYIRDDVGGSAMTRFDAALIFEALAQGCPTVAAFISIHNMAHPTNTATSGANTSCLPSNSTPTAARSTPGGSLNSRPAILSDGTRSSLSRLLGPRGRRPSGSDSSL